VNDGDRGGQLRRSPTATRGGGARDHGEELVGDKGRGVQGVLGRSGWSREVGEVSGNLLVRTKPQWEFQRSEIHGEVIRQRC
jgi:hypothetical protein